MPVGTSETMKAGELVLHGSYPFHENLTDIANASDGKAASVAVLVTAKMNILEGILLSLPAARPGPSDRYFAWLPTV